MRSSDLLSEFVVRAQSLFGLGAMTYNVHQILHLPKSAAKLGPHWSHSSFVFEGGNELLVKLVSGANDVPLQILECYVLARKLQAAKASLNLSPEAVSFFGVQERRAGQQTVLLGTGKLCLNLDESEKQAVVHNRGCDSTSVTEY